MAEKKGKLIVVSAPSGCGKTTIVSRLLHRHKNWTRSISYTTRPLRDGESNARDYFFVSKQEFARRKHRGFFLESATVFGHLYGTSKAFVERRIRQGRHVILAIDVQGMRQVLRRVGKKIPMMSIFIMPPSIQALRARLKSRKTETGRQIQARLRMAQAEMSQCSRYDFTLVNRKVSDAVKEIEELVE